MAGARNASWTHARPRAPAGADKARNIAFYSLDNFLGNNSTYLDAQSGSNFAAFVLYGLCSNERKQTINAWAAVGIGQPVTPLTISGSTYITYNNNSAPSVPVDYIASGGRQNVRYAWTYSGPWAYSITPYMGDRNTFEITNFNNAYNTTTISVNDDCSTVSKTIYFLNWDDVIVISPNPVINDLHVEVKLNNVSEENPIHVNIVDGEGQLKYQGTETTTKFVIDVSNLYFGNYFLNVIQGDISLTKQFLKQ